MTVMLQFTDDCATRKMMEEILTHTSKGERVQFLQPVGEGRNKVQALRVMLSRLRAGLESRNRRIRKFTLHTEVYPYTVDGRRCDCVLIYESRSERHDFMDTLESMVGLNDL